MIMIYDTMKPRDKEYLDSEQADDISVLFMISNKLTKTMFDSNDRRN